MSLTPRSSPRGFLSHAIARILAISVVNNCNYIVTEDLAISLIGACTAISGEIHPKLDIFPTNKQLS
jgi:hypothetical protein